MAVPAASAVAAVSVTWPVPPGAGTLTAALSSVVGPAAEVQVTSAALSPPEMPAVAMTT